MIKISRVFSFVLVIITLVMSFTGCSPVVDASKKLIAERDQLVALAQGVQASVSNFNLVRDTQYAKITMSNTVAQNYYESVAQSGEVWTGNFRSEQAALEKAIANSQQYVGGDPTKPDLAALAASGGLPSDTGAAFSLFVNSVVQAPPPVPDPAVTMAVIDTCNEAMNTLQLAGTDSNDAVRAYNTLRSSVSGEVVAAASEIIGFPLPDNFPYYQGASVGQPITDPLKVPSTTP